MVHLFSDILEPVSSSIGNEARNISRSEDQISRSEDRINVEAPHCCSGDHTTSILLDPADSLSIAGCQNRVNHATQERTIFNSSTSHQPPTASLPSTGDNLQLPPRKQLPNPYPSSLLEHKRKYDEVSENDVIIAT